MCNQNCKQVPHGTTAVALPAGLAAYRFGAAGPAAASIAGCALPLPERPAPEVGCPCGGSCKGGCQKGGGCGCGGNCGGGSGVLSGLNRGLQIARQVAAMITVKTARRRALGIIDALNDFGSADTGARLPVSGGELIAPQVGRLQESDSYRYIFAANDEHPWNMFNFAEVCGRQPFIDQVADEDGKLCSVCPSHCIAGTWGASYLAGVRLDLIDETFIKGSKRTKDSQSGCANENLVPRLRELGITDIDLCGIGVGATAVDLANAGFGVRVVVDATRDFGIPQLQPSLDEMRLLGVQFITLDEVIREL